MQQDLSMHIDFATYYSRHVKIKARRGDQWTGWCPFHEDKTPSFSVNVATGLWKCFAGCGEGNIVQFHARKLERTAQVAYRDLCRLHNIPIKDRQTAKASAGPSKAIPTELFHEKYQPLPEKVLHYLVEKRGWLIEWIERLDIRFEAETGRIAIPVKDEQGRIVNVRRYKPGTKENKVISHGPGYGASRLYPISGLKSGKDLIVLCEGEADTICGLSHGLNCVTQTAGAGTWKKELSLPLKGRHVLIAYDNDEAGRKGAEKVARALAGIAETVEILQWPQNLMEERQDVTDWFITHGKSAKELLSLSREKVVPEKDRGGSYGLNVIKKEGRYWNIRYDRSGASKLKPVSNFTLTFLLMIKTPEQNGRIVRLVSPNGRKSKPVELYADTMPDRARFQAWCLNHGNYHFKGTLSDLLDIWELELGDDEETCVLQPPNVGWVESEDTWLFGNCAVNEGRVYLPDKDGIIRVGNQGFKAARFTNDIEANDGRIPKLCHDLSQEAVKQDRESMIRLLKENLGGFEAYLVLGFVAACAYQEEVFRAVRFPILALTGKAQCGKNTLGSILMAHFGLTEASAENPAVTPTALKRRLSYFSGIPVWLDEFRAHDAQCKRHESILRSAFDRVGASKGRLGPGVDVEIVRAAVLITGEAFTEDSALSSRCIENRLSARNRTDRPYREIRTILPRASGIFLQFILEKTWQKADALVADIMDCAEDLIYQGLDARLAKLYAVVGVCFCRIYNPDGILRDQAEFMEWIVEQGRISKEGKEEKGATNTFFSDIEVMMTSGEVNDGYVKYDNERDEVVLWVKGIQDIREKHRSQRGKSTWNYHAVMQHPQDEPFFKAKSSRRLNGVPRKCAVLCAQTLPEETRTMFMQVNGDNPHRF